MDKGKEFDNNLIKNFCDTNNIKYRFSVVGNKNNGFS